MNFRRPIFFFLSLCILLTVGLVVTHMFRPSLNRRFGGELFQMSPNAITEISLDLKDNRGQWCTAHVKRKGSQWCFVSPYEGICCDEDVIANILAATRQMYVSSVLGRVQELNFNAHQYLTLTSVDKKVSCGFNLDASMTLDSVAVAIDEDVVSIDAAPLAQLPKTLDELRTRAILPFIEPNYISEITWSEEGSPFTRAYRLQNGDWEVSQADVFIKRKEMMTPILETLVQKDIIHSYVYPANSLETKTSDHIPTEILMKYGLDVENSRLTLRIRGLENPIVLSLGKESTSTPGLIYCLIHDAQSIVLVPKLMREYFNEGGAFSIDYKDLTIVEQTPAIPTMIDLRILNPASHSTYVRTGERWENKGVGLGVDNVAMNSFLDVIYGLQGDLLAIQQPEPIEALLQIVLQWEDEAPSRTVTLSFAHDESGDILVHCKETKRLYVIREDRFPERLLSSTLAYDLLEKTALRVNPASITKITLQRPNQADLILARDITVSSGWKTIQPAGAFVDVNVVNIWLKHFEKMPAQSLIVHQGYGNTLAPWGYRANGEPSYQLRITLDFDGSTNSLRNILLFAETSNEENLIPMIIQGRMVEYLIDPKIVNDLNASPFVYEARE